MTVLVATGSLDGAVRQVAVSIAETLGERDIEVTLGEIDDLERAEEFEAIVIGGEVEDGQWSPDIRDSLSEDSSRLEQHLVWLFGVRDDKSDDDDLADIVAELAARDFKSFGPSPEGDDVRSWASFIADEIDGHS